MTVLSIIQDASLELGLPSPTSVIGNTDQLVKQLMALLIQEGKETRLKYFWPQLNREYTFTLVGSQASYTLPDDMDRILYRTQWSRGDRWELIGPLLPQEWQAVKSGIVQVAPRQRYRIKGAALKQFFLDPTPVAADAGKVMAFEYQSNTWLRPKTWVTATTFLAGSYCFYDGNIYKTTLGGVTGATAPTHTSGSVSDGSVSWTYISASYETVLADTDVGILDEQILKLGLKWRIREAKGLQFETFRDTWERTCKVEATRLKSAPTLHMSRRIHYNYPFITPANVPDTNYGS